MPQDFSYLNGAKSISDGMASKFSKRGGARQLDIDADEQEQAAKEIAEAAEDVRLRRWQHEQGKP